MADIKNYFKIYESKETKAVFEQNEYEANRLSMFVIFVCAAILIASWALNLAGVFKVAQYRMTVTAIAGTVEFAVPVALFYKFHGKKRWLKYVMLFTLLLVCTQLFAVLNHNVILIITLPVLLSSRYFSKGLTIMVTIMSVLLLAAACVLTVHFGIIDLNYYPPLEDGTVLVIKNGLRSSVTALGVDAARASVWMLINGYVPRLLGFSVISFISVCIAKYGHDMVLRQDEISRAEASAKAELNTATQIQNSMVPTIFPAFPEKSEFDVYGAMFTAKEVGGDFYDFFLIDDKHLALVMADVSGKGVPAALFMMASKILINDRAVMGGTPAEILQFVNDRICGSNKADMFVTVWLGILDITTGKITAANAGHEYPVIRQNGGDYELVKDKHGFVVGGLAGVKYKNYEINLSPGDSLFLYTDGVPEAINIDEEQFGTERMVAALNKNPGEAPRQLLATVRNEVSAFAGDAEQFDDITMLCLKYNGTSD